MKIAFNLRRVFIIASVVSLVIVYAFLWVQTLSDNALRTGSDFIAFYAAGRIAHEAGISQVYNPDLQRKIQQAQVGFELGQEQILLYNHLPYVIPLTMLAVDEDYVASFVRWNVLILSLYIAALILLTRILPELQRGQALVAVFGGLLFFPVFFSLLNGQDTALLFIGAVVWVWGTLNKRDTLAGLGLSLVTIRPHIALVLAIPFFFKRRNIFWGFVIGASMLAVLSLLLIGTRGTLDYLNILGLSAGGTWHGMKENEMFNLLGILRRGLPMLDEQTGRNLAWSVFGAVILVLSIIWWRAAEITEKEMGMLVIVGLFAAPHLHYHDLTLLLIPLFLALRIALTRDLLAVDTIVMLPLVAALVFLLANLTSVLKYSVPYLFMAILLVWLWRPAFYRDLSLPRIK